MYAVSKTEAPVTKDKRNAGSEEINKQSNPNICGMGQPVTLENGRIQSPRRGIQMAFEGNSTGIPMKKRNSGKRSPEKCGSVCKNPLVERPRVALL